MYVQLADGVHMKARHRMFAYTIRRAAITRNDEDGCSRTRLASAAATGQFSFTLFVGHATSKHLVRTCIFFPFVCFTHAKQNKMNE